MDTVALSPATRELKAKLDEASRFLKKLSNPDRLLIACTLVVCFFMRDTGALSKIDAEARGE